MTNRLVLVIEDDEPKKRSIVGFLRETVLDDVDVVTAESLSSAIDALSRRAISLAVVDMSIPTFDFVKDRRGGGQPQGFGGADVLRFIDSETLDTRSVVVTQYDEFLPAKEGEIGDPNGLETLMRRELDHRFLGVIHYAGQHGAWRSALRQVLGTLDLAKPK